MFKEHFQEMSVTFAVSVVIITIWVRYANNSFYLYKNNGVLRVINPYFPFKRDISYKFGDIKEILLLESVNRMKLTLNNGVSIWYPCACLQIDMFDEHFVEKTFDEFHVRLVQLKIKTSYPNQS